MLRMTIAPDAIHNAVPSVGLSASPTPSPKKKTTKAMMNSSTWAITLSQTFTITPLYNLRRIIVKYIHAMLPSRTPAAASITMLPGKELMRVPAMNPGQKTTSARATRAKWMRVRRKLRSLRRSAVARCLRSRAARCGCAPPCQLPCRAAPDRRTGCCAHTDRCSYHTAHPGLRRIC